MTSPPKVWDGVLRRLGNELPPLSFEAWIKPLEEQALAACRPGALLGDVHAATRSGGSCPIRARRESSPSASGGRRRVAC